MVKITEDLIRRRAEHNEGMVSTLEEVALHQQNIEKIEGLGQLCPSLKIIYLQNNLIGKIQNLNKLKDLQYLNLAVNNITKIQNLQRCESLTKLDLTINFISKAGLLTVCSLQHNLHLKELYLLGNPCTDWEGYRQYVIAKLPQLAKLDGNDIKHSERIRAQQEVVQLEERLRAELLAEGIDPDSAAAVEDDSMYDENGEVKETGYIDENGELRRPWCPATRILEHRELEQANRQAEDKKKSGTTDQSAASNTQYYTTFPEIKDGERIYQRNDGKWDFSLEESSDRRSIVLEVDVGKYMDTSLIQADVQPTFVRLLIKGKLLQLLLPCEVKLDASTAQRSKLTGHLVLTMPKEDPAADVNVSLIRPANTLLPAGSDTKTASKSHSNHSRYNTNTGASKVTDAFSKDIRKASIQTAAEDDDSIPSL